MYNNERVKRFEKVRNFNCNFVLLNDLDKAIWLLLQENLDILLALGSSSATVLKYEILKRHKKVLCMYIRKAVDDSSLFISQTSFILIVACMHVYHIIFSPISCIYFYTRNGA